MILRKPYAFLIKHFRLIHLILTLPLIYIVWKTRLVVNFFNTYVSNGYAYQTGSDISSMYINWLLFLSIFLIVVSILSIYFLLKYKEKPVKLYVVMMIYYILLFGMLIWYSGIISGMSKAVLAAKTARLYRDISLLIYFPQYFFIIFTALRAVGFNIKQFNFQLDLKEMQITSEDNEEVEVGIGFDTYKTKRFFRRYKREFSYYLKENKLIISVIVVVTIFAAILIFYKTRKNYDISYSQNSAFNHNVFTINIEDSIITNLDTKGHVLDGTYYLVLKTYVKNNSSQREKLDTDNFNVHVGGKNLKPVLDKSTYFIDYANPYYGDYIRSGEEKEIALVYKLEDEQVKKSFKLKLLSSFQNKNQKLVTEYAIVNLTPVILEDVNTLSKTSANQKLTLNNTNVGNTIINIKGYEITKSYRYQYNKCTPENNCRTITNIVNFDYTKCPTMCTLLVLDYDYDLDKETTYGKTTKSDYYFFDNFVTVKAKVDNITDEYDVANVTPSTLSDKLILQVKGNLLGAEDLDMYITIRNKRYEIDLK